MAKEKTMGGAMRGRVGKRGKTWFYVVDVGSDNGRRKQEWHGGFPTRKAAQDELNELLKRLGQGTYVAPSKQTLGEFLLEWLDAVRGEIKPTTFGGYERNINNHIIPALGNVKLQELTTAALRSFYSTVGRRRGAGELSARTKLHIHAVLRNALGDAVKWGKITRNPAGRELCEAPKVRSKPMLKAPWSPEEMRQFLRHVEVDRLYAAWLLLATTGVRRGELLGLRWQDLDLDSGGLSIVQTLTTVGYQILFQDTAKTDGSNRHMMLDASTVAALRKHKARQSEERLAWGPAYEDRGLVFCRENGSPLHPDLFLRTFQRLGKAAGLPKIRLHDVRHSWASYALAAGVAPKVVSQRLGHSNIRITLDLYTHVMPALDQDAADKVAALVLGS
jgi:integrase